MYFVTKYVSCSKFIYFFLFQIKYYIWLKVHFEVRYLCSVTWFYLWNWQTTIPSWQPIPCRKNERDNEKWKLYTFLFHEILCSSEHKDISNTLWKFRRKLKWFFLLNSFEKRAMKIKFLYIKCTLISRNVIKKLV